MLRRLAQRLNHEYWPWQLIYLPVLPLYLWQAIRQRRAAFFTNVNPAIDMGGFFGERKSLIYPLLPQASYPSTVLVPAGSPASAVRALWRASGIALPLILKPDVESAARASRRCMTKTRCCARSPTSRRTCCCRP